MDVASSPFGIANQSEIEIDFIALQLAKSDADEPLRTCATLV